ncbi:uncharacterized protein [Blastocystis hominis]|uniref:Uncharacterized protein n=1 Tax=Blastocystis hominis TaxID=12968 RepID=D8MBQ9_BLAHO|nr:uncharacterized protein [Blastocystis hominis]CBK25498.2 unnamed protein product [Blastocystis hominis]|eukprot:XP_012899546.1 uncharacterized protein [Blastocystis hominis]
MDEVAMLQEVKKCLVTLSFVVKSIDEDIDQMQLSMERVTALTNSWKSLLRRSRT